MEYYKLSVDAEGKNDIICYCENDYGIQQYELSRGEIFDRWDERVQFYYIKEEGDVWTDYLSNDMGWFLVSEKLKRILESVNTDIQFFKTIIKEKNNKTDVREYYIANIIKVVDALCLEKSDYFESKVKIEGYGVRYYVRKYGIYASKTEGADVFKLEKNQEIPIFVSERFKKILEEENITGASLTEIEVQE